MPVDSKHPDYEAAAGQWQRCRDALAGQDAVHAGRERYLPKLSEQKPEEYDAYRKRAPWYGATGRTHDGLVGMVFRKAPVLTAPDALAAMALDITLSGQDLDGLAREVTGDVLAPGRVVVLVEHPAVAAHPQNLAAASAQNLRPYATVYKAEAVINWRPERVNNRMQPTLVVLAETYEAENDGFAAQTKPQLRVLRLTDGIYTQQIYRKTDADWAPEPEVTPTKNGRPLDRIPVFAFGPECNDFSVQQSPLLDLVDTNLSHYRSGADLEHGAHLTGLPMLFLAGVMLNDGEKVYLGSQTAIVSANADADGKFIEFTGQGLEALEKRVEKKEQQMAALGARMLAPEKAGVEASGTMAMRHNGEDSVLANMAALISDGLTQMLRFMADWAGIPGEVQYELNRDYLPAGMTGQDLTALMGAWQAGAISWNTLFENLQRGEIIASDTTAEEEKTLIDADPPRLMGGAAPGDDAGLMQ